MFDAFADVVPVLVSKASTINSAPPVEATEIGKYFPFLPTGNNLFCVIVAPSLLAWTIGPSIWHVALPTTFGLKPNVPLVILVFKTSGAPQ